MRRQARLLPLLCLVAAIGSRSAAAGEITLAEYEQELETLFHDGARGDLKSVRRSAMRLLETSIATAGDSVSTDVTVLSNLAAAPDRAAMQEALPRLRVLLIAVRHDVDRTGHDHEPDKDLLAEIADEQGYVDPERGGNLSGVPGPELTLPEWLEDRLAKFGEWMLDLLERALDWLRDFLGLHRPKSAESTPDRMRTLVIVLVIAVAIVLAIVLYTAVKNRGRGAATAVATSTAPVMSEADVDPLSRTATEWIRYAAELHAAGRAREAIRAWYHAVLVTCFRAGVLHHRKGRTNWEYAFSLPPQVAWRGEYLELTRDFERHWYGYDVAESDASQRFGDRSQGVLKSLRRAKGTQ